MQGAYGNPVYRHARPVAMLEEDVGFERYPPPPRGHPQWPRGNDDVIVLE